MSNANPQDPQERAEQLDDDKMAVTDRPVEELDYPPERPMGVDEYGTTAVEEQVDEPLEERDDRLQEDRTPTEPGVRLVDPADDEVGAPDDEPDAVGRAVDDVTDASAEEAAVHETAPPPMGDGDDYVEGEPRPGGGATD